MGIHNWYNCDMWLICVFFNVTDITVTELPRIFLLTMTTPSTAAHTHTHTHCRICRCTPSIGMRMSRRPCPPGWRSCTSCFPHFATSSPQMHSECHCRPNSLWKPSICHAFATWIEQFWNFDDFWTWWKIDHGESNGNDQERLNYQRATCLKLCWKRLPWFAICGSQQRTHWSALPRRPFIPCSEAEPNALCINLHIHTYP